MTFKEICATLGIEDYSSRIFSSNSHGELMHCWWYAEMAKKRLAAPEEDWSWFRDVFLIAVDFAEKNWERPESVFQHMDKLMPDIMEQISKR